MKRVDVEATASTAAGSSVAHRVPTTRTLAHVPLPSRSPDGDIPNPDRIAQRPRRTAKGRHRGLALLAAVIAVLLGGCAGQSPPSPAPVAPASTVAPASPVGSFVGAVPGTDAYIALITDGRRLAGYVCANGEVSSWFAPADLTGDTAALTGRDGTPRGTVTITATGATGEVRIDGQPHRFTADPAQGVAGLYRATVGEPGQPGFVEAGWVVANDLTQRGSATTHNAEDDLDVDPAPTLEPRQPLIRLNESVVEAIKNPPINIGDQNQQDANQNSGGATSSTPATSAPQTQPPQTQTPQTQPPQTRPPAPSGGG